MKYLTFFFAVFFTTTVFAADGEPTEYFGALWDFIDWIYEALENIKQTIYDYLLELSKVMIVWYFEIKLKTVVFVWGVVEPLIDALNLTDVISSTFGTLSPDIQAFITDMKIGEAINMMMSAHVTKIILRAIGW